MRYRSALLLSLFCRIACGQGLDGPVTVFFHGDRPLSAPVLDALQREADATVVSSRLQLNWRSYSNLENPDVQSRLVVIRFRGECQPTPPKAVSLPFSSSGSAEALGQTQVSDGRVLPFADIKCDAVRQYLGRELSGLSSGEQEELLGRALGRVVAHELYHMLLRTKGHGRTGLARPVLSRAELLQARQSFAPAETQQLAESAISVNTGDTALETGR